MDNYFAFPVECFWLAREEQDVGSFKNTKNPLVQPTGHSFQENVNSH